MSSNTMNLEKSSPTKENPFLASLKERYILTGTGAPKRTLHLVIDLSGSGIEYKVGDSIGVFPSNALEDVNRILSSLGCSGTEVIQDKRREESISLKTFLMKRANLTRVSKKFIQALVDAGATALAPLLETEARSALKEYTESHHIWDCLEENSGIRLDAQAFCELLTPMIPRFYSIASSLKRHPSEVHLTVALVEYETNGHTRKGVATRYLCEDVPLEEAIIPIYVQATRDFLLPEDPRTPIIMVGPGTGIAPFVAFLQERELSEESGFNWLFFGECHQASGFYYQDYLEALVASGKLRLDTAFSRDQDHKIYVQDRMKENASELWRQLEAGAVFYVCGDAQRMAKDVEKALLEIAEGEGGLSEEEAKLWLKKLRQEKRYLRDVY